MKKVNCRKCSNDMTIDEDIDVESDFFVKIKYRGIIVYFHLDCYDGTETKDELLDLVVVGPRSSIKNKIL